MVDVQVFDNLGALDGLIQVIYHSLSCFVLISEIGIKSWNIELGLVEENQWWKGSWSKEHLLQKVEKPATEGGVEKLGEKLASLIALGELSIKGWSDANRSKDLRLMIGSDVNIDLRKMPDDEGSTRAMTLLKKMALQAQHRGCQLFKAGLPDKKNGKDIDTEDPQANILEEKEHELEDAHERIKELERQVSVVNQMIIAERETTKSVAPKAPPGASRANPTKQKRKIAEAEFESD